MISQLDGYDGLPIDSQVILQAVIFYGLPLTAKQIYQTTDSCKTSSSPPPQVAKICENECIGFNVTNRRERTISVEKGGQSVATLSVWATVRMDDDPVKNPY